MAQETERVKTSSFPYSPKRLGVARRGVGGVQGGGGYGGDPGCVSVRTSEAAV